MSKGALQGMLPFAAVLAIVALGQTLVIQQGGFDLSVPGSVSIVVVISTHHPEGDNAKLLPAVLMALGVALSAADGHTTDGFLTFGIGSVVLDPSGHGATGTVSSGVLHGGHAGGTVAAEIQGKVMGYGGSMLAFGLAILAWLVLRPALGRIPRGVAYGAGIALVVSAAGCVLLLVVGADSLPLQSVSSLRVMRA
jgi:ribose transport system permease protein